MYRDFANCWHERTSMRVITGRRCGTPGLCPGVRRRKMFYCEKALLETIGRPILAMFMRRYGECFRWERSGEASAISYSPSTWLAAGSWGNSTLHAPSPITSRRSSTMAPAEPEPPEKED